MDEFCEFFCLDMTAHPFMKFLISMESLSAEVFAAALASWKSKPRDASDPRPPSDPTGREMDHQLPRFHKAIGHRLLGSWPWQLPFAWQRQSQRQRQRQEIWLFAKVLKFDTAPLPGQQWSGGHDVPGPLRT